MRFCAACFLSERLKEAQHQIEKAPLNKPKKCLNSSNTSSHAHSKLYTKKGAGGYITMLKTGLWTVRSQTVVPQCRARGTYVIIVHKKETLTLEFLKAPYPANVGTAT